MFESVNSKIDFPSMEREIFSWWEENNIVQMYLDRNSKSNKKFSFIDGPITANNPMGVHHAWGRTYKDLWQRFKTMQGFKQRYQNGFDGQGLWIEVEVEKELGLNSKREIETFGIDKFVELCKARVKKFSEIQTEQSKRLGYWMDWDNSYHTLSDENNYTIWKFLKICDEKGWLYEGTDVMPWCPRCGTGLSQHEIVTEGYKEVVHPGLFVKLELNDRENESLLIWTTTPWTLSSNTGVYLHPDLKYAKVQLSSGGIIYVLNSRLNVILEDHQVLELIAGKELEGLKYKGPFDELPIQKDVIHKVVCNENVNESEGTGIVHTAPGAGQEDFLISKKEGLDVIAPLDEFGTFIEGFGWLSGKNVSDVNDEIYEDLKNKGIFYRVEDYTHRYPVCWRCDTELVFRLVDEWFISMDELRGMIADVTKKINWFPEFGLDRELDWLKNMDDWMISKKRYWGLALPIFKCFDCGNFEVIGSEKELQDRAVQGWESFDGNSPHRPWIDSIKIECSNCGENIDRIKDVGNPWLDAGIVPFSTLNYRNDKKYWEDWFPADCISESYPGQFRNWFYSLLCMSTVLENSPPFKNIFSYALMRDEKGEEMHKSKGNAIWFHEAAEEMGVDSMRWLYSRHNPANNLMFGPNIADEVRRMLIIPLWNVYSFFVTYANIDEYDPATKSDKNNLSELDRWILSELNILIGDVTDSLEKYQPERASRNVEQFVYYLSNWYVRRNRRRFWKSGTDEDKIAAYSTLYECLVVISKLTAPFMPFLSESIYRNLVGSSRGKLSVHLEDYPIADNSKIDNQLSKKTSLAMKLSSIGRSARSKAGIKVRQPISKVVVYLESQEDVDLFSSVKPQMLEELNVRDILVTQKKEDLLALEIKANMQILGPKFGKKANEIKSFIEQSDPEDILSKLNIEDSYEIQGNLISKEDIEIISSDQDGFSVGSDAGYFVGVDINLTDELRLEGLARELIHAIQNIRKNSGFEISQNIKIEYISGEKFDSVLESFGDLISKETLAKTILKVQEIQSSVTEELRLNGEEIVIGLTPLD